MLSIAIGYTEELIEVRALNVTMPPINVTIPSEDSPPAG
jgi:hypothetical protein